MMHEQVKQIKDVRLDVDTWLSLNMGPMPRELVVEIHDRLLSAIGTNSQPSRQSGPLQACAEVDLSVAEACGVNATIYYNHKLSKNVCLLLPSEDSFNPSYDLNDAFNAAESSAKDFYGSVELPPCITVDNRTGWRCTIEDSPEGRGRTPALAICAAILNGRH